MPLLTVYMLSAVVFLNYTNDFFSNNKALSVLRKILVKLIVKLFF